MSAKIAPNSEKKARLIDSDPMLKRGLRNRLRSSIGAAVRSSQATNATPSISAAAERPEDAGIQPAPLGRLDDRVDERHQGPDRQQRAGNVEAPRVGVARVPAPLACRRRRPTSATGTLMRKTEDQSKYSSSRPPNSGPRPTPIAAVPAHTPIALARSSHGKTFVMIDSVAGMISAPPTPISARTAMSCVGRLDEEDGEAREAEERDAGLQRALAAEAVAEHAEREQQAGEGDEVGVDHPLQASSRRRRSAPAGTGARR